VEVFGLITLADTTGSHQFLHKLFHVREMKIAPKAVEGALDALVTVLMDSLQDLRKQR
jgi:hypothetical protein